MTLRYITVIGTSSVVLDLCHWLKGRQVMKRKEHNKLNGTHPKRFYSKYLDLLPSIKLLKDDERG